jgi:outer membrane biosynthesis protein TonB
MKNMMFGFILLFALLVFRFTPWIVGNAQATPLIAQAQQPAPVQPQKVPVPPKPVTPSENQQKEQPSKESEVPQEKQTKEQSSGPYDMEAMKAFNRALYGS